MNARARYVVSESGALDEAFDSAGAARPLYSRVIGALDGLDLTGLAGQVTDHLAGAGVEFGGSDGWPFVVDPVPRLFEAAEWAKLEAGLKQRVAALDAFVADVHGERRAIEAGIVPAAVIDDCPFVEPDLFGLPNPPSARVAIGGLDLVRDARGELMVLEDNCRTPSGLAYSLAAREAVTATLGELESLRDFGGELAAALRALLQSSRPDPGADGALVLMSDGAANTAWYEHQRLAELAGALLVAPTDLRKVGDHLELRSTGQRIDVIYRRTDIDRLRHDDGSPTSMAELLLPAIQAGTVTVVNGFGTGVADDKVVHAHVEELVTFYLGEQPLLRSVPTLDLADDAARVQALERIDELVFKPRDGHGGHGVLIGPRASAAELAETRAAVTADPVGWIAQEVVALSTHPTVIDGALEPRHVDLRPFVIADGQSSWRVVPGGLTRVALARGELVVNSSRGGGGKDTWVLT